MKIVLTEEEIEKCKCFSSETSKSQRSIEFGEIDTIPRSSKEISRDSMIGKMAEVAFSKLMKEYKIDIELDFNIYPIYQGDNADAVYNGWKIDVKSSRYGARWLLVEEERIKSKKCCDIFVMAITDWNRETDQNGKNVELIGFTSKKKLKKSIFIKKGDLLPGKNVKMQSSNFGIRTDELCKDWDLLATFISSNKKKIKKI